MIGFGILGHLVCWSEDRFTRSTALILSSMLIIGAETSSSLFSRGGVSKDNYLWQKSAGRLTEVLMTLALGMIVASNLSAQRCHSRLGVAVVVVSDRLPPSAGNCLINVWLRINVT